MYFASHTNTNAHFVPPEVYIKHNKIILDKLLAFVPFDAMNFTVTRRHGVVRKMRL